MWKISIRQAGWVTLAAVGLCSVSLLSGQEKAAPNQPINLTKCRIKLIDSVELAAARTGIIAFVEPDEGDEVAQSQKIAGLVDDVPRASLAAAEEQASNDIEVRFAAKNREVAEAKLLRALQANKQVPGTFPDLEVKQLRLEADKSVLQIEQAERQYRIDGLKRDEARENLKQFRIEAPFDGIVTKVYKQRGEAVREGDKILDMVSVHRVKVEGYLPIQHAWHVKEGAAVQVQLELDRIDLDVENMVFEGRVSFVDVKAEGVTSEVRITAEVQNKNNVLRDGLFARMTVFPGRQANNPADVEKGARREKPQNRVRQ
jgi:multidrug efflux pump subunit AcrA (membrane-fusion protein)